MKKSISRLTFAGGLFLGVASVASAATFSFAGNAGDGSGANTLSFSSTPGGISVSVTGWTFNGSSYSQVSVGQYSGGLGVQNGRTDDHTVDNSGNVDFLRFAFSTSVDVNSVGIGYVSGDSDFKYWIANSGSTSTLTSGGTSVNGSSSPNSYAINTSDLYGTYLWIGAQPNQNAQSDSRWSNNPFDHFKVSSLNVSTPPSNVPDGGMSVAMLGLGLLGLAGLKRRVRR